MRRGDELSPVCPQVGEPAWKWSRGTRPIRDASDQPMTACLGLCGSRRRSWRGFASWAEPFLAVRARVALVSAFHVGKREPVRLLAGRARVAPRIRLRRSAQRAIGPRAREHRVTFRSFLRRVAISDSVHEFWCVSPSHDCGGLTVEVEGRFRLVNTIFTASRLRVPKEKPKSLRLRLAGRAARRRKQGTSPPRSATPESSPA